MKTNRKSFSGLCAVIIVLTAVFITGCKKKHAQQEIPPKSVETAQAMQKDVPLFIDTFGTLSPINNVDIKSQVSGKIETVHFTEGDTLATNDLLFTIDKRPYQAMLDKAQAAVAAGIVQVKLLSDTLKRNESLREKELISQQDFEEIQTNLAAAQAQLLVNKADVESAQLNLDYCDIRSPIDGITGKRLVDAGNIVTANSGATLVNVKSINTLYIDFTVTDQNLEEVRKAMSEGTLEIILSAKGEKLGTITGKLNFLDNTVDTSTGTIALRGVVQNNDRALWPGQFVDIELILGTQKNATLVPYDAVQIGKQGMYLFVVSNENKADLRIVTVGGREDNNIIITKGVKPGETIVTVGQLGLSPGATLKDVTKTKNVKPEK